MSTISTARGTTQNERKTRSSRPRVPSLRSDATKKPTSQSEHSSQVGSAGAVQNGTESRSSRGKEPNTVPTERKREKAQVTTQGRLEVHLRSPRKQATQQEDERRQNSEKDGFRPPSGRKLSAEIQAETRREQEDFQRQLAIARFEISRRIELTRYVRFLEA